MTLSNRLIFGSAAASLIGLTVAHAADLPTRQAAPIEYVRICDAYGAGFFYIPGTDTCLKVGGLALTEVRSYDAGYSISPIGIRAPSPGQRRDRAHAAEQSDFRRPTCIQGGGATTVGFVPTPSQYNNSRQRDNYGWNSLGRIELDARTGTPWGVLRSFIRVDSYVGTGYSQTGALSTGTSYNSNPYNTSAGVTAVRETTIVNKAFIQFAGLTAGRAQSMFDFYANAYNYQRLGGSAATTQLLAYTYVFGNALPIDGLSATLSVEDKSARETFIGSTIASAAPTQRAARPSPSRSTASPSRPSAFPRLVSLATARRRASAARQPARPGPTSWAISASMNLGAPRNCRQPVTRLTRPCSRQLRWRRPARPMPFRPPRRTAMAGRYRAASSGTWIN